MLCIVGTRCDHSKSCPTLCLFPPCLHVFLQSAAHRLSLAGVAWIGVCVQQIVHPVHGPQSGTTTILHLPTPQPTPTDEPPNKPSPPFTFTSRGTPASPPLHITR